MWDFWQSLTTDQKLTTIAIGVPLLAALGGFLGSWFKERENSQLTNALLRVNILKEKADALATLEGLPPAATEQLREDIAKVFGERLENLSSEKAVSALNIVCSVSAMPVMMRSEGLTEQTGEILLTFTGDSTTAPIAVEVSLNANITNRDIGNESIDAYAIAADSIGDATSERIYARRVGATKMVIDRVQLKFSRDGVAYVKIKNVRINTSQLGAPKPERYELYHWPPFDVVAFVSITLAGLDKGTLYISPSTVSLGRPMRGNSFRIDGLNRAGHILGGEYNDIYANAALLKDYNWTGSRPNFVAEFREGFASAFKTLEEERGSANERDSTGTRFILRFFNVPTGVSVFVTAQDTMDQRRDATAAVLVEGADVNGGRGSILTKTKIQEIVRKLDNGLALVQIPIDGEFGFVVWEYVGTSKPSDMSGQEVKQVRFGVVLAAERKTTGGSAAISVAGDLAPLSTSDHSSDASLPRFIEASAPQSVVYISGDAARNVGK